MNKQTYHTILESVEIRNNILTIIQALNNVMSTYDSAGIRHMTLEEAKDKVIIVEKFYPKYSVMIK